MLQLKWIWTLCTKLLPSKFPLVKNKLGKWASYPIEAGAANNVKKVLKSTNLAPIEVHIARVGPVKAMVNTGAMYGVIEKKMIETFTKRRKRSRKNSAKFQQRTRSNSGINFANN